MSARVPRSRANAAAVAQQYRRVNVDDVSPHPDNPRRGDVAAIAESIEADGFYGAIVVQSSTGYVLAGNHRLLAARRQGLTSVPAIYVDVDDAMARRILLVDNRTSDLAGWDQAQLAAVLEEMGEDLAGTGFTLEAAMDAIANARKPRDGLNDPDEAPPTPADPISALGDVWSLGAHRLVVGDATDPAAWDELLEDQPVDFVFTDPPYGVSYVGKTADALTIGNDEADPDALSRLLSAAWAQAVPRCRPGAVWYVCAPTGPAFLPFALTLREAGLWRQTIVWVKDAFVLGHADYHQRHEALLTSESMVYGWRPGAAHQVTPDRSQDTVWEFDRPRASRDHPTMKPIALITKAIENSARPAALVVDCFAGSGSTLIACERTGRTARCLEVDPRYADVIARRWAEHTGQVPLRNGEPTRMGGEDVGREGTAEETEPAEAAAR